MTKTNLRLLGWSATGLRCPDHNIDLTSGDKAPYPISLIQMPNGVGKTTTLTLLRAALSGAAASWDAETIRGFRKPSSDCGIGTFQVRALVGTSRLTIQLVLDFNDGSASYSTTFGAGKTPSFDPPASVLRFFTPNFVNFFVFDGELAEHLLSSQHGDARKVVQDLFRLDGFVTLTDRLHAYWKRMTAGKATEDRGLARRQNKVLRLKERINTLEALRAEKQTARQNAIEELDQLKKTFHSSIENQGRDQQRLTAAELQYDEACDRVKELEQQVLALASDPASLSPYFAEAMVSLRASFDKVKLPETAAREFFEELAAEAVCICGRPLDDASRKLLTERATQYLGSDDVALFNAIKSDIASQVDPLLHPQEDELVAALNDLQKSVRERDEARTSLDALKTEIASRDPKLRQLQDRISDLEGRVKEYSISLDEFEDPSDDNTDEATTGIAVLKRRLEKAELDLAEITNTIQLKAKKDIIDKILRYALEASSRDISEVVRDEANKRIRTLMPHNRTFIASLEGYLRLENKDGASVGETLTVAYAFLATLFNRAEHVLPFIVDSPANPIDLAIRRQIAALVPRLSEQFVAFMISSERQGFLEYMERNDLPIQYLTLFRKGDATLEQLARHETGMVETLDGILVPGRSFFHSFHVDKEPELLS
jgi:DNA sulfur modification protein DndD